jgi:hypothetical protein
MKRLKIKCCNCEALFINQRPCHEIGCPSITRPWVEIDGYLIPGDFIHETAYFNEELNECIE